MNNTKERIFSCIMLLSAITVVIGIVLLFIGGVDSVDSGAMKYSTCYRCDGSGLMRKSGIVQTCSVCNGTGIGAYRESGENLFASIAWTFIIVGTAVYVISSYASKREKDYLVEAVDNIDVVEAVDNIDVVEVAGCFDGKWICGNCKTENSINYGQCKKCGKFRG